MSSADCRQAYCALIGPLLLSDSCEKPSRAGPAPTVTLSLDDTVEFFNLALGTQLTDQEKKDLVVFLRAL